MNFIKKNVLLIFLLLVGGALRFSYLTWGYPFFFHPDENNIATAISQLSFPSFNPHFFAYGSLPIYITYLFATLASFGKSSFATSIYTLRTISAVLSFLMLPSLFYIGKKIDNEKVGFWAALLASVSVGLIQFAHFGTFEMWLTFFGLWLYYACFLLWKKNSLQHILFVGVLAGILMSTKISSIVFLPLPLIILFLKRQSIKHFAQGILLYLFCLCCIYVLTNPFIIFDTHAVISSLSYESSIALGTLPVFYTQSFLHTIPIAFQFRFVFPFLLNPFMLIFFLACLVIFILQIQKQKQIQDILLIIFFLIAFLSQAFLFTKWTRYMVPTLPFIYLICAVALTRYRPKIQSFFSIFLYSISLLFSLSFFLTVYPHDSRLVANDFAKQQNTFQDAIAEPFDLGSMAFNTTFPLAQTINLYALDSNPYTVSQLTTSLKNAQIFLSPSQRLLHSREENIIDFPKGSMFYKNLLNGTLGFRILYQTPCDFWCTIAYTGNPITNVEETASVFDHPIVTILEKK